MTTGPSTEAAAPNPSAGSLTIVVVAALITALDSTVLNVAIPTILRDFHTDLPSLQWVLPAIR